MSAAAATNKVTPTAYSHAPQCSGIAVNPSIPVAGMETWKRQAIQKVIGFNALAPNWDAQGSNAPSRAVIQTAIEFLRNIPGEMFPVPLVVPISGGGFHLEWEMGDRDLEIAITPNGTIEALRVEHGMPIEDDPVTDLAEIFGWLAAS